MEGQQQTGGSPLSALGLGHLDGPDLLQEKLEGKSASESLPSEGERDPQTPTRSPDLKDRDLKEYLRSKREDKQEAAPHELPGQTEKHEQEPDKIEPDAPTEDREAHFHLLNGELQAQREQLRRMEQDQQRRSQEMQQWLKQQQAPQTPPQPAIEDYLSQELGIQDPGVLKQYNPSAGTARATGALSAQYRPNIGAAAAGPL
jgi:DNA-binding transcriptional MocR family regulator